MDGTSHAGSVLKFARSSNGLSSCCCLCMGRHGRFIFEDRCTHGTKDRCSLRAYRRNRAGPSRLPIQNKSVKLPLLGYSLHFWVQVSARVGGATVYDMVLVTGLIHAILPIANLAIAVPWAATWPWGRKRTLRVFHTTCKVCGGFTCMWNEKVIPL